MPRPQQDGLYLRGDIYWCRWHDHNNQLHRQSTGCRDPDEATAFFESLREKHGAKPNKVPTVADILAIYHTERGQYSKRKGYGYAREQIQAFFAGVEWERLGTKGDSKHISKYIAHRQRQGVKAGSINIEIGILSAAANLAVEEGINIQNHARGRRLKEQPINYYWLTIEQARALIAACEPREGFKSSPHLRDFVVIALGTGMRTGEVLKLHKRQIDLVQNVIRLSTSKSGQPHEIPMTSSVLGAVLNCLHRSGKEQGWLFWNSKTGGSLKTIILPLKRAATRAGIPLRHQGDESAGFRVYDTRHSAASMLLEAGATLDEIGDVLNHSDPRMTRKYAHRRQEGRRAILEKLPEF